MPKCYSEQEREYTIKRLKEEAAACMGQFGIRCTTVDELVKRVNIPKGTFYLFYKSKELLLSNAAKYSDGDLKITLDRNGYITFKNRASHLSEVEAGKLFDRFYTVENVKGSTGLGLSIARLLTEKMGGSITASWNNGYLVITLWFPL